ncbi:MAG: DUF134 domain-containing protein [Nitrososphaeria archaeon]
MSYRHRHRHGRRGRLPKPINIERGPAIDRFTPMPSKGLEPVHMNPAELEAFRLVDQQGLSQEEAGKRMGVSRGTVWRLLQSARGKAAQALSEGRPLNITENDSTVGKEVGDEASK